MIAKSAARNAAKKWWSSADSAGARNNGHAVCDWCQTSIHVGEGYLCKPGVTAVGGFSISSPDLICEACFDKGGHVPLYEPKPWWKFW